MYVCMYVCKYKYMYIVVILPIDMSMDKRISSIVNYASINSLISVEFVFCITKIAAMALANVFVHSCSEFFNSLFMAFLNILFVACKKFNKFLIFFVFLT